MVEVKPVTTKRDLRRFIRYPWKVYRGSPKYPHWVPPLLAQEKILFDRRKNPFFRHAEQIDFLAFKDGDLAGRISGIIDQQFIKTKDVSTGYFGFFESADDPDVARALFREAEDWVRQRGMKRIIGPMNPTPNHILGVLIDDFDGPPVIQIPYNPPYYLDLYKKSGYKKEKDHYAYYLDQTLRPSDKIKRVAEIARKRGSITVRTINMKKIDEDVKIIREIYNNAWSNNSDFVPWTAEEFDHMAKDLKLIAIPELILIAFVDGAPAGFSVPLPDINQILIKMNGRLLPFGIFKLILGKNKVDMVRLALLGIKHEFHNKGIDAIFVYESYIQGEKHGFKAAEMSLVIEDNYKLRNMLETWGVKIYRTYRIFEKAL